MPGCRRELIWTLSHRMWFSKLLWGTASTSWTTAVRLANLKNNYQRQHEVSWSERLSIYLISRSQSQVLWCIQQLGRLKRCGTNFLEFLSGFANERSLLSFQCLSNRCYRGLSKWISSKNFLALRKPNLWAGKTLNPSGLSGQALPQCMGELEIVFLCKYQDRFRRLLQLRLQKNRSKDDCLGLSHLLFCSQLLQQRAQIHPNRSLWSFHLKSQE